MSKLLFFLSTYAVGTIISAFSGNLNGVPSIIGIAIGCGIGTFFYGLVTKNKKD